MTDTATAEEATAPDTSVRGRLAAAAKTSAGRTRRTTARKATARKATTAPKSRGERASARGQHAKRIAPLIKLGSTFYAARNPVAAMIIEQRADPFANALDAVAAEDPRVDALLTRIAGWAGKGGAWGKLTQETTIVAGGLMLASGRAPAGGAGMVLAMFAGALVEQATVEVATRQAWQELDATYGPDHEYTPDPVRVQQLVAALLADRASKAAPAPDGDEDQAPADDVPAAPVRESVFSSWSR